MKIDDHGLSGASNPATSATSRTQWIGRDVSASRIGDRGDYGIDRVEVSETAETISKVLARYSAERESEIASTAKEVQSGRYQIDSAELSKAILDRTDLITAE